MLVHPSHEDLTLILVFGMGCDWLVLGTNLQYLTKYLGYTIYLVDIYILHADLYISYV